ncbi:MAG: cytochrome b5 domain-containing protein [Candidatus Paceibacterota bacterium]|jgi:hypothetical protein
MKKIIKSLGLLAIVFSVSVLGFGANFAQAVDYTAADVASHSTSASCWVIINNTVYDLTNFIPLHPGGPAIIISVCGKDGTTLFNSGPHPDTAINALSSYIIGNLAAVPVLTTINVTPATPAVVVGNTQQMTATTLDQNGAAISATVSWTSSNPAVGTINPTTGLFTAVAAGTTTLTATSGAVTGSTVATVTAAPAPIPPSVHHDDDDDESEIEDRDGSNKSESEKEKKTNNGRYEKNSNYKNRGSHKD